MGNGVNGINLLKLIGQLTGNTTTTKCECGHEHQTINLVINATNEDSLTDLSFNEGEITEDTTITNVAYSPKEESSTEIKPAEVGNAWTEETIEEFKPTEDTEVETEEVIEEFKPTEEVETEPKEEVKEEVIEEFKPTEEVETEEEVKEETKVEPEKTTTKTPTEAEKLANAKLIAAEVHDAVDGWGTDEDALKSALIGLTKEEADLVKQVYEETYGKSLEKAIKGDTSGQLEKILLNAIDGKTATKETNNSNFDAKAVAKEVFDAVDGWGTDEDALKNALIGLTAEQAAQVKATYEAMYGESLEKAIKGDTSGQLEKTLLNAIDGKTATKETPTEKTSAIQQKVVEIHDAIKGAGTDEDALKSLLLGMSTDEANKVKAEYEARYGESLEKAIKGDTSGQLEKILVSAIDGKTANKTSQGVKFDADAVAAQAYKAMKGAGTDEEALKDAIIGLSSEEASQVAKAFEENYGKSLRKRIKQDTSGQLQKTLLSYIPE